MDFLLNENDSDDPQTTPYQQPPVTYNQRPAITYNQPQTAAYNQRPAITYNLPQTDAYNQRPAITYNQPQTAAYSPTLAYQQAPTYTQPSYQLPYQQSSSDSSGCCVIL